MGSLKAASALFNSGLPTRSRRAQRLADARATRDAAEEIRINNATRAEFEQARIRWAPAHDHEWLRQANLLQIAEAWSAALVYADNNAAAAAAVGKCEQRLRDLHPHAMEHIARKHRTDQVRVEEVLNGVPLPPIRFHDLRHGAATLALAARVDMKVISETLGHARSAFTADTYTSILPELAKQAAEATAAMVPRRPGPLSAP